MSQEAAVSPQVAPPRPGLFSRFMGIVLAPTETFSQVVKQPSWFGMILLTSAVTAVFVGGFLSTVVGREAWLEEATESSRAFGGQMTDAQIEQMEGLLPYMGPLSALQSLIVIPFFSLVVAGVLYLAFSVMSGATATFKQLFSVVAHAGAITALLQVFIWPLNYFRQAMSSPTSLSVFLPMLDEGSYLFRVSKILDLTFLWWISVLAIGLGVLYQKAPRPIAFSLMAVYLIVALAVAALLGGA